MRPARLWFVCAIFLGFTGCHIFGNGPDKLNPQTPTSAPTSGPAVKMATFDGSSQYGITVEYPADWKVVKDDSPLKAVSPDGTANLSLYWRKLTGMEVFATAHLADGHYQDDMKNKWCTDAVATTDAPLAVPDADARKIVMDGHKDGKALTSMAAFMIREHQVYVLTVECPQGDTAAAGVFDQAVASIKWTR